MPLQGNPLATAFSTINKQTITGNGTVGPYTLDYAAGSDQDVEVFVNNVRQEPGVAYTVAGTAMTMTGVVQSSDDFYVLFQGKAQQTVTPAAGSVIDSMIVGMASSKLTGALPAIDGSALTGMALANRNLIINGAMTVAQRGTSGTISGDNSFVSLDRWGARTYGGTGRFSVAQDTTVPTGQTFTNSLKATVTTTTTSGTYGYSIKQNLEGYTVNQLRTGTSDALKSTLSFWARSSVAGTYCCSVRGTAGAASYVFEYTLAADTWTKIEHTIAEPTTTTPSWDRTNAADYLLEWSLGGQTSKQTATTESWQNGNYTSTSNQTDWIATSGATFYLTGVQLEVGETATPFEHRSYGDELARCQRYFAFLPFMALSGFGSTAVQGLGSYTVDMRATPSFGSEGVLNITNAYSADYLQTSTGVSNIASTNTVCMLNLANFSGVGNGSTYYYPRNSTSSNRITLDAEL
jgi:hypothetical protein